MTVSLRMALFVLMCLLFAGPAAAQDATWGIERLMIELGRVQHAKGRFVERKYLKILKAPLESTGSLEYVAPDRVERRTLAPKPESFVVDGDRLTLENARGQRRTLALQDNAVLWAFVESIRSTLKGDLAALGRFYDVSLRGGERDWHLLLKPKQPKMAAIVEQIEIAGARNKIDRIEIREARGDRSVMTISEENP